MTIQEILEAHAPATHGHVLCECRLEFKTGEFHRAHVAEVLDKHMQEREAKAWDHGHARALSGIIPTGNEPEPRNPYKESPNGR